VTHGVGYLVGAIVFVAAVVLAAPGLTWLDGGELALASGAMGVAHPPGQPGYVVLARLAALLPVGDISFRLSLFSALTVAWAAGLLAALVAAGASRIWGRGGATSQFAGVAAGLSFGLGPAAALQAVRPELYGLAILLGLLAVSFVRLGGRRGGTLAILSLSLLGAVHPAMLLAAAPGLVLLLIGAPGSWSVGLRRTRALAVSASVLAVPALGLFAWLPLRSMALPAFDFGTPQSWDRILWSFTGATYSRSFQMMEGQLLANIRDHASLFVSDLGLGVLFFGVAGAWALGKHSRSSVLAGLLLLLVGLLPTVLQGAFRADNPDVRGYLLGPCAVLCGSAGLGLAALVEAVRRSAPRALSAVGLACCIALVIPPAQAGIRDADFSQQWSPSRLSAALLDAATPGGLVVLGGDSWSFPSLYLRYWEGRRPDLAVLALHMLDEAALPALHHRGLPVPPTLGQGERVQLAGAGPLAVPEQLTRAFVRHADGVPLLVNDTFLPPELLSRREAMGILYQLEEAPSPALLELAEWEEERFWLNTVLPMRDAGLLESDVWARSVLTRRYASRGGYHRCQGDELAAAFVFEQGASLDPTASSMVNLLRYRLREGSDGVGPGPAGCPPPVGPWDAAFSAGDDEGALAMLQRPPGSGGAPAGDRHWEARLSLLRASSRFLTDDPGGAAAELSRVLSVWPTHPVALLLQERLDTLGVRLPANAALVAPSGAEEGQP